jgi:hypothetical protein
MTEVRTALIVPADQTVEVNGESYRVEPFPASAAGVLAIKWFGTQGRIETDGRAPAAFTDKGMIEPYMTAWRKARAKSKRAEVEMLKRTIEETEALIASHEKAMEHFDTDLAAPGIDEMSAAVLKNHMDRTERETALLRASLDTLHQNITIAEQMAVAAESEA